VLTPLILLFILGSALLGQDRPMVAPANAPAQLRIAARDEPGTPLRITGTVVNSDGAPVNNASLYVYQTDARGLYTNDNNARPAESARLHGWLRSDRNGRFEITTIRPGAYPNSRIPQHVHFVVNAQGYDERIFEIVFDDDANVDARVRSEAQKSNSDFSLCKPVKETNGIQCVERVVLKK
jgi:protocatechuate 3,4-dioxygenase beta subunit